MQASIDHGERFGFVFPRGMGKPLKGNHISVFKRWLWCSVENKLWEIRVEAGRPVERLFQ